MQILINSRQREVQQDSTLEHLLQSENVLEMRGIAVAVNGEVVPRNFWQHFILHENASILIIKAAQGG